MSEFFSELSSKVSELFAPRVEDWVGWCKDVANFHKEKAGLQLDWVPHREMIMSCHQEFVSLDLSRMGSYEEFVSLYENQTRWHEKEACFHKDRAGVHQDEVRKCESCSYLDENEARFHGERACFHQSEADKCKLMVNWYKDSIRLLKDKVNVRTGQIHWCEDKICLDRDFASWYQAATRGDIDLTRKKVLVTCWKELVAPIEELGAREKELYTHEKELNAREKEINAIPNEFNDRANELAPRVKELNARGNKLSAHWESLNNHRLPLLQHPAVVQRRELIRVLQNIYKILSNRNDQHRLSLQNENTSITPWGHVQVMKLALNWLEASIYKELGALGIKVTMTM
jgi:hypothetical protein